MNTNLLDGFGDVLGCGCDVPELQQTSNGRGWHIYRPPSRTSRLEPLPNFLRKHRSIRRYSTGTSGHTTPDVAVGSSVGVTG